MQSLRARFLICAIASTPFLLSCESEPKKKERGARPEVAESKDSTNKTKKETVSDDKPGQRVTLGETKFVVSTLKNEAAFGGSLPPALASDVAMTLADLVSKEPGNAGALVTYLGVLRLAGQSGATYDDTVRRAGSVAPKNPWFLLEAGYGALARNDVSLADFLFSRAERNAGGNATVKAAVTHAFGVRSLLMGQVPSGIVEIKKAASASPPYLPALLTLGFMSLKAGDGSGAERIFRAAVAADANNANAVVGLATSLRVTGKGSEAASLLAGVYKARSNDRRVAWNYALALAETPSSHAEALSVLNRYFQMPGALPEIDERANALVAKLSAAKEKPAPVVTAAPVSAAAPAGKEAQGSAASTKDKPTSVPAGPATAKDKGEK